MASKKRSSKALFIFRRDFRLTDNIGLIFALNNFDNVAPIFIFTPEQITNKNKYKSNNAIQFMIESLKELDKKIKKYNSKLHFYYGDNIDVIDEIVKKNSITHIIFNKDYTPYARSRDRKIKKFCMENKLICHVMEDYLLKPIGSLNKKNGDPYTIYTPFKNNAMKLFNKGKTKVDDPVKFSDKTTKPKNLTKLKSTKYDTKPNKYLKKENKDILVRGGRKNGLKILKNINNHKNYNKKRDMLECQTTQLSAYIKFGCVSIREVYYRILDVLGSKNELLAQILWREFYFYIVYYFPKVLKGKSFSQIKNRGKNIKWNKNKKLFHIWCDAQTGYPIVDAGMTQLNITGYMHNRARLITANFLNRMLGQDWRLGEEYYATKLTDYDSSVNSGNWQWVASVGVDPKPYWQRLFNPWTQGKKYDPDAKYIKKWLPQLKNIPAKHLHAWDKHCHKYDLKEINYYDPIVDYKEARKKSIKMYKS